MHVRQVPDNVRAHRRCPSPIPQRNSLAARQRHSRRMDEWNYWYGPHVFGELGTRYFLKDALGIAAGLHEYFRDTDIISMANYAQTVNVIGCIKTTKTHAEFDSTGLALMLYRNHFGTIPIEVTHQAAPLDISAALTSDKKNLTIGVVNPKPDAIQLKFDFKSLTCAGQAQTWRIAGSDPMAFNQPGEPRRVDIQQAPPADLNGSVSVQPYSITLWRLPVK